MFRRQCFWICRHCACRSPNGIDSSFMPTPMSRGTLLNQRFYECSACTFLGVSVLSRCLYFLLERPLLIDVHSSQSVRTSTSALLLLGCCQLAEFSDCRGRLQVFLATGRESKLTFLLWLWGGCLWSQPQLTSRACIVIGYRGLDLKSCPKRCGWKG